MVISKTDLKPGSIDAWLNFLEKIDPNRIKLGLDRAKKVLSSLNLENLKDIKIVEVAGTNGKGSTAALIANSLSCSGIKTGLYTSPHLKRFNERIAIDGRYISDDDLCKALGYVYDHSKNVDLTYFEYTTLAAIYHFYTQGCKAIVLEVGLGGRLDAVNIIDADVSVITSVGLDHTAILGDTIEKIAYEKAGIIKEKSSVVTGILSLDAKKVVYNIVKAKNAQFFFEGEHFEGRFTDGFTFVQKSKIGTFESYSLATPKIPLICAPSAIKTLMILKDSGLNVNVDGINRALKVTSLPGRMQLVKYHPAIYLDVAHNPPAAEHLVKTLNKRVIKTKRYALIGMLKDKDIESVISILKDSFDGFYVASLHTQRGEMFSRIVDALKACQIPDSLIRSYNTVEEALTDCVKDAKDDDEIIVLGSFVTVSLAVDCLVDDDFIKKARNKHNNS